MEKESQLLLLRFGELWLKSHEVQRRFRDRLLTNLRGMFQAGGIGAKIIDSRDRIFVEVSAGDFGGASAILSHTFGLVSFSPVSRVPAEKTAIIKAALALAEKIIRPKDTFAIRAQRSGNHPFSSAELERECGAEVVKSLGNKVNLTKPDKTIFVDVRDANAYVFSEKMTAAGGLPLGVEGKLVAPFEADFQRWAAASYLMLKRGCRILPVFAKEGKDSKKAVAFLQQFDPHALPYFSAKPKICRFARSSLGECLKKLSKRSRNDFSGAKDINKFALELCRKKKAGGIVLTDGIEAFYAKKKPRMFDRKARVPYLYPLVGYTGDEVKQAYETVS